MTTPGTKKEKKRKKGTTTKKMAPTTATTKKKGKAPPRCRIDFWLREGGGAEHWLEVKNCHLVNGQDGFGYFPDSVSERASRHLRTLDALAARRGHRVTVVFVVQRADVRCGVRPSDFHDPAFAATCRLWLGHL